MTLHDKELGGANEVVVMGGEDMTLDGEALGRDGNMVVTDGENVMLDRETVTLDGKELEGDGKDVVCKVASENISGTLQLGSVEVDGMLNVVPLSGSDTFLSIKKK